MPETRRKFDVEFREGAVRIVRETEKSIAQVARELGVGAETLRNWVKKDKVGRGEVDGLSGDEWAELARFRAENAEVRMERDDDAPMFVKLRRVVRRGSAGLLVSR